MLMNSLITTKRMFFYYLNCTSGEEMPYLVNWEKSHYLISSIKIYSMIKSPKIYDLEK